jgi:hypothetical protein
LVWPLLSLLVVARWATLWLWSASPYGRLLDHGGWGDAARSPHCAGRAAGRHRRAGRPPRRRVGADDRGDDAADDVSAAGDVPPDHRRTPRRRSARDPCRRRILAVWLAFGVAAHLVDAGVRWAAAGSGWFVAHGAFVGAAVLAGAGLFQWSALKYRCLDECRTPFGFVASRWHGVSPAREALRIGIDHGIFCVGCCWALMLTMFVVGIGSVGWMLALAALMAAEKNLPFGRHLRTPGRARAARGFGRDPSRQSLTPLSPRCDTGGPSPAFFVAIRCESSDNSRLSGPWGWFAAPAVGRPERPRPHA